ncbi:MAG: AMP-binding protein [Candidatus Binatia bacterium]
MRDAGGTWRYDELLDASARAAAGLLDRRRDLGEARVAFLVAPGAPTSPPSGASGAPAASPCRCAPRTRRRSWPTCSTTPRRRSWSPTSAITPAWPWPPNAACACARVEDLLGSAPAALPAAAAARRAMILYTSGTTSKPKGVVTTHAGLAAQIASVVTAWEWSADDHILHVLPLHHLHGILNLLCAALWAGALCELQDGFDADAVWRRIEAADGLTLFMAVPTIYARLRAAWEAAPAERRAAMRAGCRRLRLMVSGSAALPVTLLDAWRAISGHTLLERYGMTEIGMGLGNPLHGERRPGHVGIPFPGIDVRLVDEAGAAVADGVAGQIEVRGAGVFREYWRRPADTAAAFTADAWFRTGDVAVCERGSYRILGRESIDIIKTGGFKVSALEIEDVLRTHPAIAECAVVGVADDEWGQRVAAAVVLRPGETLELDSLRAWAKERLAPYKVPTRLRLVADLPRNPMGKVIKPDLAGLFS